MSAECRGPETSYVRLERRPRFCTTAGHRCCSRETPGSKSRWKNPGRKLGNNRPAASPPDRLPRPTQNLGLRPAAQVSARELSVISQRLLGRTDFRFTSRLRCLPLGRVRPRTQGPPETREICIKEREGGTVRSRQKAGLGSGRGLQVGSGSGGNPLADVARVQTGSDFCRKV